MAIALEFLNLIIPIKNIDRVYPGGFEQYKIDNAEAIGKKIWYDEYIVRDGAMGWEDIETLLNEWRDRGLELVKEIDGQNNWSDVCVLYDIDGPTLPCDWIASPFFSFLAFLNGMPSGQLVRRENMH